MVGRRQYYMFKARCKNKAKNILSRFTRVDLYFLAIITIELLIYFGRNHGE